MNFDLGSTEKTIIQKLDKALHGAAFDQEDTPSQRLSAAFQAIAATGYTQLWDTLPTNSVSLTMVREKLATLSPSLFLSLEAGNGVLYRLAARYGSNGQKNEIMDPLRQGEAIGAVAMLESNMNMEDNPLETTAIQQSDGYLVSGTKRYVINGSIAQWIGVIASVGEEKRAFIISNRLQGLRVEKGIQTLGLEDVDFCDLYFEACNVPSDSLMAGQANGDLVRDLCTWQDQILVALALGLMQRAYEAARDYAKTHKSGGKPIIAYQEVGFKLAEMLTLVQTAQLLAYRAAWMVETGDREADILLRCAKVFCTECAEKVASQALQITGGAGYVKGNPAEQAYRDAKFVQIAGTSTERSRMKLADGLIGLY